MCSWAARPGSVAVTIVRSPSASRRTVDCWTTISYTAVDGVKGGDRITAVSRTDKAGDLLVFDANKALAVINVVPTAGFSDTSVATTPGEIALANGIVRLVAVSARRVVSPEGEACEARS